MAKWLDSFSNLQFILNKSWKSKRKKEKKRVELVARGSIGPFWLLTQNGQIEPHRSLISSFALFFLFLVTVCELGIGFPKELCVVGGCGTLDVWLVLATCGWWEKCRESLSSGQEAARSIKPWKFYCCQQPAKGVGYAAQV